VDDRTDWVLTSKKEPLTPATRDHQPDATKIGGGMCMGSECQEEERERERKEAEQWGKREGTGEDQYAGGGGMNEDGGGEFV
jgi:hypothetical protein